MSLAVIMPPELSAHEPVLVTAADGTKVIEVMKLGTSGPDAVKGIESELEAAGRPAGVFYSFLEQP